MAAKQVHGLHITQPEKSGYQVRIVRQGKEYSRWFSINLWNGKRKAMDAAINWREQMLMSLGRQSTRQIGLNVPPNKNKKSTGTRGVSRSVQTDARRNTVSVVYSVCWFDKEGTRRSKTFHVGHLHQVTVEEELHAYRTAIHFRREFEDTYLSGKAFHPENYKQWRYLRLYENATKPEKRIVNLQKTIIKQS